MNCADPFVRLTLGSISVDTTHREDSQDPEYNEKLEITLEDIEDQVLKVSVWDKGNGNEWEDGLIGEGEFNLNEIEPSFNVLYCSSQPLSGFKLKQNKQLPFKYSSYRIPLPI